MANQFKLDVDRNLVASLIMTCPKCGRRRKEKLAKIKSGTQITCECGEFVWEISGDDLSSVQRSLNDLKRTLKNFGK